MSRQNSKYSTVKCTFLGTRSVRSISTALQKVIENLNYELQGIRDAGTWKSERVITSAQDVGISVQGSQGKMLNFCSNNYLGLSVIMLVTMIDVQNITITLVTIASGGRSWQR